MTFFLPGAAYSLLASSITGLYRMGGFGAGTIPSVWEKSSQYLPAYTSSWL